jgi:hypothetical protein
VRRSLKTRIRDDRIRASAKYRGSAPSYVTGMDDMDWWNVTLKMNGRQLTVPFGMGYGHNQAEPTAENVLSCLLSDASDAENAASFEDWCSEYGRDTDSRSAERTYRQIRKQTEKLSAFLGEKYHPYLRETAE